MAELFEVDAAKCVKCGLCVEDCAFGALKRGESNAPEMAKEQSCMRCQHCLAICPTGAIAFDGRKSGDCTPVKNLALPTLEETENWLRSRRSIRRFAKDDVDRGLIERLLSSLGNTPTGCNARSLTFTCLPDRASMERFKHAFVGVLEAHRDGTRLLPRWLAIPAIKLRRGGNDIFFRNAPGMLVVSSDTSNPAVTTPVQDVTIACSNFELLANAAGLATCWCGFLNLVGQEVPEILERTLGIKQGAPFYAMLFGKPAVRYSRCVRRENYARIVYA